MDEQIIYTTENLKALGFIWSVFAFALGGCVGSFLNVVIYRLPRDKSLVKPGSMCPSCNTPIKFYHNIPILSWLLLGGKCKYCGVKISSRYVIIEFITALIFLAMFLLYFGEKFTLIDFTIRQGLTEACNGAWLILVLHLILIAAFLAASAIDMELWVIPLSICWFVTLSGIIASIAGPFLTDVNVLRNYHLFPSASAKGAAVAAGGLIGLVISLILLFTGIIKTSYQGQLDEEIDTEDNTPDPTDENYSHRLEVMKEVVFLLPIVICSLLFYQIFTNSPKLWQNWVDFSQIPALAGFFGAFLGYLAGCGVVWATRIFGTLAFGKEAMGLGDVHLMGAAGAVIGPAAVTVAFFIAPFIGLAWAVYQMFFKKTRQIPYGPFLSIAIFVVMIAHNPIMGYIYVVFFLK